MYEKKYNISAKRLEIFPSIRYNDRAVTLIAVKREVAAYMNFLDIDSSGREVWQVFRGANVKLGNWRQVTVRNHNSRLRYVSLYRMTGCFEGQAVKGRRVWISHDTHGRVYSHRLSY